jgi:hypothetical protein
MCQAASEQFLLLDRWCSLLACFCQPLDGPDRHAKRAADARDANAAKPPVWDASDGVGVIGIGRTPSCVGFQASSLSRLHSPN